MDDLKLTRDDREFLRSIDVDPEPTDYETMIDVLTAPGQYEPPSFIISQELARAVIKEYGELNWENFMRFRATYKGGL